MDVIVSTMATAMGKEKKMEGGEMEEFSYCYLYRFEQFYVVAMPS